MTPEYWTNGGYVLLNFSRCDNALQVYNETTEKDLQDTYAWYNKGTVREELGRREESQECFYKVKELEDTGNNIPYSSFKNFLDPHSLQLLFNPPLPIPVTALLPASAQS